MSFFFLLDVEPLDVIMVDEKSTGPMIDRDGHLFFGSLLGHENSNVSTGFTGVQVQDQHPTSYEVG